MLPPLIVIVGPTASGKTDLAAELALEYNGEIINADSRQIYKEINIASAKPKFSAAPAPNRTRSGRGDFRLWTYRDIPHHLFDEVRPDEDFNVTHFKSKAIETIGEIHARNKLPFLVGGTGLWVSAVINNLTFPAVPPDLKLRTELGDRKSAYRGARSQTERALNAQLYQELLSKDPDAKEYIDPNNRRRIIRALEVMATTGNTFSSQRQKEDPLYRVLQIGITWPIEELEKRITVRIDDQIQEGLEQEAKSLLAKYDPHLPALSSISLREWHGYFEGKKTLTETLALIRLHNRQYAKRQLTWFKRDKRIQWIKNKIEASSLTHEFLISPSLSPPLIPQLARKG